jgi:nucleosome binding factor SPN SPT16 subunit
LVLNSNEIRSYSSYCANVGRTYFVNPTADQEKAYNAIVTAQTAAIAALVENAEISRAYEAALESLKVAY